MKNAPGAAVRATAGADFALAIGLQCLRRKAMSRALSSAACSMLLVGAICTTAAAARPHFVCIQDCADDDGDGPQPCNTDGTTGACCVVVHCLEPRAAAVTLLPPPPQGKPSFIEPLALISYESSDIFHVPKAPLA